MLTAYSGTVSNKTTLPFSIGYKANMYFNVKLNSSSYTYVSTDLYRSSDLNIPIPNAFSSSGYSGTTELDNHLTLPDGNSTFRAKMVIYGNGKLDSLITDEISFFNGAKTVVATVKLTNYTATYSFSPVSYY